MDLWLIHSVLTQTSSHLENAFIQRNSQYTNFHEQSPLEQPGVKCFARGQNSDKFLTQKTETFWLPVLSFNYYATPHPTLLFTSFLSISFGPQVFMNSNWID